MHDDQLRRLLRTLEDPREPDPAFADALFNRLGMVASNERRSRTPFIVLAAAVLLVALMAGVAIGSGLIELPFTADVSPTPSATAPPESGSPAPSASEAPSPTPASELAFEPPPGVLPQFAVVVVNEPFQLRAESSVAAEVIAEVEPGTRMTTTGPLLVDGERWYTLSSLGPADPVSGAVVLDPAGSAVELEPVECPAGEPDLSVVAPLSPWERLACYSDREIVFEGYEVVGFGGFVPGVHTPDWLNGTFGALAIADPVDTSSSVFVHAPPDGVDLTRPQPSTEIGDALLRVTGHFNDDASAACSSTDIPIGPDPEGAVADIEPIAAELFCRGQFVVTEFEVLDEGSGDLPELRALEVGGFVAPVVDGVTLRQSPGTDGTRIGTLALGSTNLVVEGPVDADGYSWYRLSAAGLPPSSGCIAPLPTDPLACPIWFGWAAAGNPADDTAWFVPSDASCPDPDSETLEFLSLAQRMPVNCYGDAEVTFTAWYPELPENAEPGGSCDADPAIGWLYCAHIAHDEVLISPTEHLAFQTLFVDPASGVTLPERGQWLRVRGVFNHPDAALCGNEVAAEPEAAEVVLECRSRLVMSSVEVTTAP